MEVISLWHCWGGMEAQVSLTVAFSSSAFFCLLFFLSLVYIFLLTIQETWQLTRESMGFRSGEFAGQSNTPTPWSFNQLLVFLQAPPLAVVLLPGSLYTFPHTYGPWPPWLRAWCPCTVMCHAPKKTSISKSSAFKPVRVMALRWGDFVAPDPWADLHLAVTTDWLYYTT